MEKSFDEFKLKIDWKPSAYHGRTIRKNLSQALWKKIRLQVLEEKNKTCSICAYSPENNDQLKRLHVHEIEEYSTDELLCILKGLDLICIDCHSFYHLGRTITILNRKGIEKLKAHFLKVNKCTEDDFKAYYKMILNKKMNESINYIKKVTNNFSESKIDNTVLFRIDGDIPYKEEVIEQLKDKGLYRYYKHEKFE
jgi:5-methylcytosine-specific restriction endonuclease McrA